LHVICAKKRALMAPLRACKLSSLILQKKTASGRLLGLLFLFAVECLFVVLQPSVANATNIDTLLANKEGIECVKVPPEALQDKVFFIFNNLSMSNMDPKVR
jgi:hypothetical protein